MRSFSRRLKKLENQVKPAESGGSQVVYFLGFGGEALETYFNDPNEREKFEEWYKERQLKNQEYTSPVAIWLPVRGSELDQLVEEYHRETVLP